MRSSRIPVVGMIVLLTLAGIPPSVTAPLPTSTQQDGTGTVKHAANGSLSYLAINGSVERNDTVMLSQDVGSAVSLETVKFKQEYEYKRIKAADENASNETAFTIARLETIEARTDELQERQNERIQQYNEGEITSKTFLRELALITSEADRIQVLAGYLSEYAENDTLARQANDIKQELYMFKGPVRTRIQSALNGDPTAPNRFFVRTSAAEVVLSTIDDSGEERTYVREAYLDGARSQPDSPKDLGAAYMREMVNELYGISGDYMGDKLGVPSLYRYQLLPPEYALNDEIKHYVDRGSGNIVFESQKIIIDEERTVEHEPKTNRTEQLTLTQRTTFSGGYMYVRLTNPDGEPLNGTISVDGRTVGTTDEDSLLMLQPSNGSTITGTVGSKNVSVTVGNDSRQPPAPAGNP